MERYKKKMTSGTLHLATVGPTFCNCCFPNCQEVVSIDKPKQASQTNPQYRHYSDLVWKIERIYPTKKNKKMGVPKGKNSNPHAGALGAPNF